MTENNKKSDRIQNRLAYYLLKKVNKALRQCHMIEDGDRILVAVSGGKDSLTLLRLLQLNKENTSFSYDLVAVHVESDFRCEGCIHRGILEHIFQDEGIEYSIEQIHIPLDDDGKQYVPNCFWCSWNRRKALFLAAHRLGCNKVAFGHHADDVAETTLLNLFFHGRLETMEPKVVFFNGVFTVIRPLVFVPESEILRFAKESGFPSQLCQCPNSLTSKRTRMKEVLKSIERECPKAKINLYKAVGKNGY
jgi:tRNA 2-thiocytidine biosynthesis protein TtcA